MYSKILVPLDGSKESEAAVGFAREQLSPDGELVLLRVIPPAKGQRLGEHVLMSYQIEETELSRAVAYLREVCRQLEEESDRQRCEAIIGNSVPQAIIDFAAREGVDLIAMCTHDRKGFSRVIKRSVSREVERKAPGEVDVKVVKGQALQEAAAAS